MPQTETPHHQHLISSTAMKPWTPPDTGMLAWHNLEYAACRHRTPGAVAYEPDFVAVDAGDLEQRWGAIESNIPALQAAVHIAGPLDPAMQDVARQVLALHWGRSRTAHELEKRMVPLATKLVHRQLVTEQPELLSLAFRQRYSGIHPAGRESLLYFAERNLDLDPAGVKRSFRDRVVENFDTALTHLKQSKIEVCDAAPGSEFVLSDIGALTVSVDSRLGGPLYGVTWSRANTILMPLGPDVMIAAGPAGTRKSLTGDEMERLNMLMVQSSVRHVAHRSAGLCSWIDAVWRKRPRRLEAPQGARQ